MASRAYAILLPEDLCHLCHLYTSFHFHHSDLMFWSVRQCKRVADCVDDVSAAQIFTNNCIKLQMSEVFCSVFLKLRCFSLMMIKSLAHLFQWRANDFSRQSTVHPERQNKLLQLSVCSFFPLLFVCFNNVYLKLFECSNV